jgi:hypothetical protein
MPKYLVAKWGYSMILATWVKVIKESPKSLLVQEVKGRTLTEDELTAKGLKPAYLQCYSVPTDVPDARNGEIETFRIFKRDGSYRGTPPHMSSTLSFTVWDGEPEFEDHCD